MIKKIMTVLVLFMLVGCHETSDEHKEELLVIEKVTQDVSIKDLLVDMFGEDHEFVSDDYEINDALYPKSLKDKKEPLESESLKINIDSDDAKDLEKYYEALLESRLELNLSDESSWSFVSVLKTEETSERLSIAWISSTFIPHSDAFTMEVEYASFDLSDGHLLKPYELIEKKDQDALEAHILDTASEFIESRKDMFGYPETIEYVDTITTDTSFENKDVVDDGVSYIFIESPYSMMKTKDGIDLRISMKYINPYAETIHRESFSTQFK